MCGSVGRKDQLEEDMELKRMNRVFPGSFAEATEEKRPHIHHHHRAGHRHHSHVPHSAHHRHARPSLRDAAELDSSGFAAAPTRASALVQSGQKPILDDSKLNADLAAFSDATNELGKEENQMKSDAAKFAADMDAATVNAGSFLQTQDRSEEDDSKPSSLAEMGETTALGEWRKRMEERQHAVKERQEEQRRLSASFHPLSFLETGSKDLPDFGSDDLDTASSEPDLSSFDHSSSDSLDTPDFTPPSDSTDTDTMSPSLNFGDSTLDDPSSSSTDFG